MAKICNNCKYCNSDTSHYCVKCGKPLEKIYSFLPMSPDKKYKVIAETELNSLRNERDSLRNERNRLRNSWGIKIENWINDNIDSLLWIIIPIIIAGCLIGGFVATCDNSHAEVIEIQKDNISGKFGIFNNENKTLVTPYEYDSISHRKGRDSYWGDWNIFYLYNNGKFGVADSLGRMTISCELDRARATSNGVILYKNGKQGFMDNYGHQILPCEYQYVLWEKEPVLDFYTPGTYVGNIIPIKRYQNSGWELFDRAGKKIIERTFSDAIQTGIPDLIRVKYNGYYGLVNAKGEEILSCKAVNISKFKEGKAFAYYSKKSIIVDSQGKKLGSFPNDYYYIWLFSEGLFAKRDKDGKIRFYNEEGKSVFSLVFEQAKEGYNDIDPSFHGDSARVSYHGQNGYVYKNGCFKPAVN